MAAVANHGELRTLSLRNSPAGGTAAARAIACALAAAPRLEDVDVTGTVSSIGAAHVCAGVAANGRGSLRRLKGVELGRGLVELGVGGAAVAALGNEALLPNLGNLATVDDADVARRSKLQLLANVAQIPFDAEELKELYRFFFCAKPPNDFDEARDARAGNRLSRAVALSFERTPPVLRERTPLVLRGDAACPSRGRRPSFERTPFVLRGDAACPSRGRHLSFERTPPVLRERTPPVLRADAASSPTPQKLSKTVSPEPEFDANRSTPRARATSRRTRPRARSRPRRRRR